MDSIKSPKWDLAQAISQGGRAYELALKYRTEIENRLKPGEIEELNESVKELENRRSGQGENLTDQKSKTAGQDDALVKLHLAIMDIRQMVKASTDDPEILKAYGIGEKLNKTSVSNMRTASNSLISAYNENMDWSNNEAGILDEDLEEVTALYDSLLQKDEVQEKSKFTRKIKTQDKNVLQRRVEDLVTKISAIGVRVSRQKSPDVITLFEDLIP